MARLANQLRRASAELAHLEAQLGRLEARTTGKRHEVERLRLEVQRLQHALEQESGAVPPPEPQPSSRPVPDQSTSPTMPTETHGAPTLARTEAIVAVLRTGGRPMTPTEITDALTRSGRTDQLKSVTATLTHLLNKRDVERVGRGLYVAPPKGS